LGRGLAERFIRYLKDSKLYFQALKRLFEIEKEEELMPSKLVARGKCCQFTGGMLYIKTGEVNKKGKELTKVAFIHSLKLEALGRLLRGPLRDKKILVAYQYVHERDEMRMRFPQMVSFSDTNRKEALESWNKGEINILLIHPDSASDGLNLQYGGYTLVWYSTPWSKNQFDQTPGRINRQGQTKRVQVYQILIENTVDMVKKEVLRQREEKQEDFLSIIQKYKKGKQN